MYPGHLSLISNANCLYFVNFSILFVSMFRCCGHAMSHIKIFLSSFISRIRSGLLEVIVLHRRDNKKRVLGQTTTFSTTFVVCQRRRCKLVISLFTLSLIIFTFSLYNLVFMKDALCENSKSNRIFHNPHSLLYNLHDLLYNFSPPIIQYPKVPTILWFI